MRPFAILLMLIAALTTSILLFQLTGTAEDFARGQSIVEPTEAPTAAPKAQQPRLAAAGTLIQAFSASPAQVDPGTTITLQWQTSGGAVTIVAANLDSAGESAPWKDLPPAGAVRIGIPPGAGGTVTFGLTVQTSELLETRQLDVKLTCPYSWFLSITPDTCARSVEEHIQGIYQPFQHGMMVRIAPNAENPQPVVRVMLDSPASRRWEWQDAWKPDMPISDPQLVAPHGLYQPERALGLVWRAFDSPQPDAPMSLSMSPAENTLGWATAPEVTYTMDYQCEAHDHPTCWFSLPDGRVVEWWSVGPGWVVRGAVRRDLSSACQGCP